MTPSEIITADCQQHGVNPEKVLAFVASVVQKGKGHIMSAGNSVLLIRNIDKKDAELHLFTQDSPMQLVQSLPHFISIIRKTPVRCVYGKADNPGIVQMLKRLGVKVEHSDRHQYNWMAKV